MSARAHDRTDEERLLVRTETGQLFDARTRQPVTLEGLATDLRYGRRFRATEARGGGDCTYQVLAQVLLAALAPTTPGATRTAATPEPLVNAVEEVPPPGPAV
ncbi:polyhydroxyalkanoate synthesis regulator DNA-binding domain-containing protein [Streptomyces griseoviridis]|uniref:polyhydroxyalkanoate synthesis regulator DNA-binding domain-containing protein n=1 Tax=Streptomyces griseoviridis TaxID=45398 RepID=UPI00341654FB